MNDTNRIIKLAIIVVTVSFMYWLNPYLLIKDKEKYLWDSAGYEEFKYFSIFRISLARYVNAKGTYRDSSGNSALDMAAYFNNKEGAVKIIDLYSCSEISKGMKISEEKGYYDFYLYFLSEFNSKCDKEGDQYSVSPKS